jgi:transcriptional regulator with XRE-family HTH domain
MRKLERYRLREGITKRELARRLNTSEDAIHYWLSGRTIGRKATVERIKAFLEDQLKR